MLSYFRFTIVKDKTKIRFNVDKDTDIVWIEAHNPHTAELMAIRWYDNFVGKRNLNIDTRLQMHCYTDTSNVRSDHYLVHGWEFSHKLVDGHIIKTVGFGRTPEEGKVMAQKYAFTAYPDEAFVQRYFKASRIEE